MTGKASTRTRTAFRSKYASTCAACLLPWSVGTLIVRRSDDRYQHAMCGGQTFDGGQTFQTAVPPKLPPVPVDERRGVKDSAGWARKDHLDPCRSCREPITVGQQVRHIPDDGWWHESCRARYRASLSDDSITSNDSVSVDGHRY